MSIKTQDRYSNLVSNTLLFAISGFGSKILSIVLTRVITKNMGTDEYGAATNIISICNVILPVMYLCISEAIIRYGSDETVDKTDVFTTGILVTFAGYFVTLLAFPLMRQIQEIQGYTLYVYLFLIASSLRTVSAHFVRAKGKVRTFAIDGIITSVLNFVFIMLFIVVLDMGVVGYVLATILPDVISALFLNIAGKNLRFFSISNLNSATAINMLKYSVPLVPAAVSWWVTSSSNKILLTRFIDTAATGLFEAANKVPQLLIIVSTVFIQAWQLSAFSESSPEASKRFFSRVFNSYSAIVFIAGSVIILLIKPLTFLLVAYEGVWVYTPYLVVSVVFSCLVTFLGTIYNYHQKNAMVTITTIISAIINIAFNMYLIPKYQLQGAAIATFVCYLIVFVIRLIDTRRFMKLQISPIKILVNTIAITGQAYICIKQINNVYLAQTAIFLVVLVVNARDVMFMIRKTMNTIYVHRHKGE